MSTQLDLVIKAKSEYDAAFRGLQQELEKTHQKTGKLRSAFNISFTELNQGVELARKGFAGLRMAGDFLIELGSRGAAVADLAAGFETLSARANTTSEVMLGALREGVVGTISDFGLMELANKALGAGLIRSAEDMSTLAQGARALADRTGGDTKEAFDTLTSAIASGRTAQLKQLGLFVDSKVAVEQYAKSLGKSVSDLTDVDRAQALSAATLAKLKEELLGVDKPAADFADRVDQLRAGLINLQDSVGLVIAQSFADLSKQFSGLGITIGTVTKPITDFVNLLANGLVNLAQIGQTAITNISNNIQNLGEAFRALRSGDLEGARVALGGLTNVLDLSSLTWKDYTKVMGGATNALSGYRAGLGGVTEGHKKAAEVVAKHATELRKLDFVLLGMENDIDAATLSLEQHLSTFADLSKFVPLTTKEIEEFNEALGQGPEMDPDVILGPLHIAKAELDRMAPTFGNALRDGFKAGLDGLGDVILGAIQGGGDVAKAVGAKIFGDVGAKLGDQLAKSIGGTLGSTLGSLLGPIGTLVGSWLGDMFGKVTDWFAGLFGGKSEVDKARDAFFSQWEDGFVGVQRALLGTMGQVENEDWVKELFDARSMEELEAVIAKIRAAIASIAQDVPPVHVPVTYGSEGAPVSEPEGMAHGGVVLPFVPRAARGIVGARPGGTLVRVGEGGQAELVAPVRAILENAARIGAAAAAARGGEGRVAIILDGEVVGRWFTRRNKAGLLPVMVR